MPTLSARVRVAFDEPPDSSDARPYALRGTAEQMREEIEHWADVGVEQLAIWPGGNSRESYLEVAERFAREVGELG
jgi:hypothetical protein